MVNLKISEDFDGFITPDGELVSIKNSDKMFSIAVKGRENIDSITGFLWWLAEYCSEQGYLKAAHDYLDKILSLVDAPSEKVRCLYGMAVIMERMEDYEKALNTYL